jgi:CDK-activating kinase assembly factor MAT1
VPYCGKTLRKKGFHKAFFGDLKVERECDIRKRVGAVFNRRQEEFETLRDWNNYLEEVEDLIWNLVEGTKEEKARAEERLLRYKESNVADIEDNRRQGIQEAEMARKREIAEREAARQRRLAAMREEEEEKMDVERSRIAILDRLATSNEDAVKITQQAQKVVLKKSSARRALASSSSENNGSALDGGLTLRGLKKKEAPVKEKLYDPFGDVDLQPTRYVLQNDYESEWLVSAKSEQRHAAGGYSLHEYYSRTMFEAFSGLGVFIEDEVAVRAPAVASRGMGTVAGEKDVETKVKNEHKMELDDVF